MYAVRERERRREGKKEGGRDHAVDSEKEAKSTERFKLSFLCVFMNMKFAID